MNIHCLIQADYRSPELYEQFNLVCHFRVLNRQFIMQCSTNDHLNRFDLDHGFFSAMKCTPHIDISSAQHPLQTSRRFAQFFGKSVIPIPRFSQRYLLVEMPLFIVMLRLYYIKLRFQLVHAVDEGIVTAIVHPFGSGKVIKENGGNQPQSHGHKRAIDNRMPTG